MGRQKFSGQPENQINALGVHCANCVDLSYPGARIRAMMACSSICFIPSSLRSSGPSDEARVSVDLREGGRRPCPLEFIFFKEHIGFEFGGVPMPLTGAIPEGPSFFCPHCGALYAVTYSRLSSSDSNVASCVVCGQIMDKWDSTKVPTFRLVHRPEDY